MLGFLSSTKYKLIFAGAAVLLLTSGYFYIKYLHSSLETARIERLRLTEVINNQQTVLNSLRDDIDRINRINRDVSRRFNTIEQSTADFIRRFRENSGGNPRNLEETANRNPNVVQQAINRATRDALRCNEIVTGAALTEDERNGRTTNTICPELFERPTQ
jgi:ABC-type transporter Mla subunit MlaD